MNPSSRTARPLIALLLGALALAAGLGLAQAWLPEWRGYLQGYRELAQQAGARLAPNTFVASLAVEERGEDERATGNPDPTSGLRVKVSGAAAPPGAGSGLGWQFQAELSPRGQPLELRWAPALGVTAPRLA